MAQARTHLQCALVCWQSCRCPRHQSPQLLPAQPQPQPQPHHQHHQQVPKTVQLLVVPTEGDNGAQQRRHLSQHNLQLWQKTKKKQPLQQQLR